MQTENTPRETYEGRRRLREAALAGEERIHERLGYVRLGLGVALAYTAWRTLYLAEWPAWALAVPVGLFLAVALVHGAVLKRRDRARRGAEYYARGLERLDRVWRGETGSRFLDGHHLYASDLDLFGERSLFRWMNQARTRMGEEALAGFLLEAAPLEAIRARGESVRELAPDVDLRETMSLAAESVAAGVHPDALRKWATAPAGLPPVRWLVFGWNGAFAVSLAVGFLTGHWSLAALTVAGMAGFGLWLRPRVLPALHAASDAVVELEVFAAALEVLEAREFGSARLRELRERLTVDGQPPSARVRELARIADWIDSRDNPAVRMIGPPWMMGTHLAYLAEGWRARNGERVGEWIAALGEFEALLSVAGFAYENPEFVWPEWVEGAGPVFAGEAMRHPLLDPKKAVANGIAVDRNEPLVLVSGSNMSGKSTFLRTVGLAVVLAQAGAPVPAARLRLSRLRVGASIATHDSLAEGASRFFAEISRLRAVMSLAESGEPVLFLLDELLSGTNSRDRRTGAEGVLRGLRERGAVGLVTTHDLALAEVSVARHVHFADSLVDGKIHFDYRMREGVVPGSNAIALMHALGLPV